MSAQDSKGGNVLVEDADVYRSAMAEKMGHYALSAKYTDLVIRCGTLELDVHRTVICAGSPVFERMCDSSFKEGTSGIIDMKEDDPKVVRRLINGLYDYQLDDVAETIGNEMNRPVEEWDWSFIIPRMIANAKTYALAEKYEAVAVKAICVRLTRYMADVLHVRNSWIGSDSKAFMDAVRIVWDTTPSSDRHLRGVYLKTIAKDKTIQKQPCFAEFMQEFGDFPFDIHTLNQSCIVALEKKKLKTCMVCKKCLSVYGEDNPTILNCVCGKTLFSRAIKYRES